MKAIAKDCSNGLNDDFLCFRAERNSPEMWVWTLMKTAWGQYKVFRGYFSVISTGTFGVCTKKFYGEN